MPEISGQNEMVLVVLLFQTCCMSQIDVLVILVGEPFAKLVGRKDDFLLKN